MDELQLIRLKVHYNRVALLNAILTAILILALWLSINAQIAGYENDIVWRLCHNGIQVPLPVQAWSDTMIDNSCVR